jgi:diguanylate cyclase (GGDEF)-like protein
VPKTHVLIAEDEPHLRDVLRFQLESVGFVVHEAGDGNRAVELAGQLLPDLILLDVMMPLQDGFQVCRTLRASFLTRHIPIIILTAKSRADERVVGLAEGANDYVIKPWNARELMLRVKNVLEWSRQQRSASPLTGLPGNISINEEITRRLRHGAPFALIQIDIDHFKSFNDHYGYARGDEAIKSVAQILVDATSRYGGEDGFVGHIGGDDFVVLCESATAGQLADDVIEQFDRAAPELYDPEDRERGFVEVRNRQHQLDRFPIMSITMGLVATDRLRISHLAHLIDIASDLKAHGKGIQGSVVVGERRNDARPDTDAKAA